MKEFAFDVKLWALIRVNASTEEEARASLAEKLDCATCNAGAWDDGEPIEFEASPEGNFDLVEVDGEAV